MHCYKQKVNHLESSFAKGPVDTEMLYLVLSCHTLVSILELIKKKVFNNTLVHRFGVSPSEYHQGIWSLEPTVCKERLGDLGSSNRKNGRLGRCLIATHDNVTSWVEKTEAGSSLDVHRGKSYNSWAV